MRILVIHADSNLQVPILAAYEVSRSTRRSYIVQRGSETVAIPKRSSDVFVDATIAIEEHDRRLRGFIRRVRELETEVEEAISVRRSREIVVELYDKDGGRQPALLSKDGRWS